MKRLRIMLAFAVALVAGFAVGAPALADTDPLPSWIDGQAKSDRFSLRQGF